MLDEDLVSIITPAWWAERFIASTIDSVLRQTYPKWEMLVVDDCSPDGTASVVDAIARRDVRVRLLRHATNGGPAAARNTAVAAARGRWIAMLDSDDQWLPDKLEKQLVFHRRQGCVLTYTAYHRVTTDASRKGKTIRIPKELTYGKLLGNTAIATSTVLIDRRAAPVPVCFKPIYYDDFGCWLELLRAGGKACGLQEDLMHYRVVNQSVSRNKLRSAQEVWKTYRQVERYDYLHAAFYFMRYAMHALIKYSRF